MTPVIRRVLASLTIVIGLVPALSLFYARSSSVPLSILAATTLTILVAVLLHVRTLEVQLFARSVLWCSLVWFTLVCLLAPLLSATERPAVAGWGLGTGLGLLLLDRDGLNLTGASGRFTPVALRGTLLAVLIMAMSDTLALGFWSFDIFAHSDVVSASMVFFCVSTVAMLVALIGLYQLRTWGFVVNVLANIGIATGAWLMPDLGTLATALTVTAVGQLLVGLPLLFGLATGRAPADSDGRLNMVLSRIVIICLLAVILVRTS